jgi:hypothetical protein
MFFHILFANCGGQPNSKVSSRIMELERLLHCGEGLSMMAMTCSSTLHVIGIITQHAAHLRARVMARYGDAGVVVLNGTEGSISCVSNLPLTGFLLSACPLIQQLICGISQQFSKE